MSALEKYKKIVGEINKAKSWRKHLSATGRNGERGVIHSINANPSICLQYSTGGKNYWECKEETGEVFLRHLNDAISKNLSKHIDEALAAMQADADKCKDEAKQEYANLFGEDLAA